MGFVMVVNFLNIQSIFVSGISLCCFLVIPLSFLVSGKKVIFGLIRGLHKIAVVGKLSLTMVCSNEHRTIQGKLYLFMIQGRSIKTFEMSK